MPDLIDLDELGAAAVSDAVKCEVSAWAGISVHPGPMPGSAEVRFRHRTLGYLHPVSWDVAIADLSFSPELGEALIVAGRARPHPMIPGRGWISAPMRSKADAAGVIGFFARTTSASAASAGWCDLEPRL